MDIYSMYETIKARNDFPTWGLRKGKNTPLLSHGYYLDFSPSCTLYC